MRQFSPQVLDAVLAGPAPFNQWVNRNGVPYTHKPFLGSLGPGCFIGGNAEVLVNQHILGHVLAGFQPEEFTPDGSIHHVNLVFFRTLAANHAEFAIGCLREGRNRDESLTSGILAMYQVVTEVARRADPDCGVAEGAQEIQVMVNGTRFLAGVSEDCHVEAQVGVRFTGQKEQAGALDTGSQIEDMILPHSLCRGAKEPFSERQGFFTQVKARHKCIDTLAHGGRWLTALEVEPGRRVWQANEAGQVR